MGKSRTRWTGEEIQKLTDLAQKYPTANIAAQVGRSVSALVAKAHELKLSLRVKRGSRSHPRVSSHDPGPAGLDLNE